MSSGMKGTDREARRHKTEGLCAGKGQAERPGDTSQRVFVRAHCTRIYNPQTGLSLRLWFLSKPRWAGNVLPLRVHLWELQPGLMGTAHSQAFFCSVQWLSRVQLFATPWTAAQQDSLSITNSRSLIKLMSIESVMPPNYLIFCCLLLLLPSVFPNIRVFSN